MPVKPLSFKGDKKSSLKKRKHHDSSLTTTDSHTTSSSQVPADEDDSWTSPNQPSDLNGPALLVLPTIPPTCLASDPQGNVFASPLENMVDDDPRTAEPHDVRQVWIASKIAGMEDGEIGFKGAHGGWLGCDEYGILGARREARGMEEGFGVQLIGDEDRGSAGGQWRIRTAASKRDEERYLSAVTQSSAASEKDPDSKKKVSISLRGDGTPITNITTSSEDSKDLEPDTTRLIIRMQFRFLPRTHQQQNDAKAKEKISRRELEATVGRKLDDDEVKRLKRAKRGGNFHEEVLDVRVRGKHDKFA